MSDALVDAETLLAQLPDAVTRRRLGERLSQAAVTLRNSERQIARIAAVLAVAPLVEFGKTPEQNDAIEEVKDHASAVGKALEEAEDAESLRAAVHDYENSLTKSLASLERLIQERWRAFASEKFQPVIGIGELLTSMNIPTILVVASSPVHGRASRLRAQLLSFSRPQSRCWPNSKLCKSSAPRP